MSITMRQQFVTVAGGQFGSGWAWLVLEDGQVGIIAQSTAQTPLTVWPGAPHVTQH
jgi:superoxide dismutase, Fe-Mn family